MRNLEKSFLIFLQIMLLVLCGCQRKSTVCEEGTGTTQLPYDELVKLAQSSEAGPQLGPTTVQIGNKAVHVDNVIEGPICNESLSGTIYVGCDVQVAEWDEDPFFFSECDFSIAPGAVVYVAAHNNTPYYQGCSCHTGEVLGE